MELELGLGLFLLFILQHIYAIDFSAFFFTSITNGRYSRQRRRMKLLLRLCHSAPFGCVCVYVYFWCSLFIIYTFFILFIKRFFKYFTDVCWTLVSSGLVPFGPFLSFCFYLWQLKIVYANLCHLRVDEAGLTSFFSIFLSSSAISLRRRIIFNLVSYVTGKVKSIFLSNILFWSACTHFKQLGPCSFPSLFWRALLTKK